MNRSTYEYAAGQAILRALGITIDVSTREPGEVIINICNVPTLSRELMDRVEMEVNNPAIRPLTDMVTITYDGHI
jgi:phage-related baseplate assembly protein